MKITVTAALAIVACVFIATACPSIYTGDSGETCATAYTLGIGHPPGYPVYTMLAKIFTFLPVGDAAFRINLLAALSGAIAVFFIFLLSNEFIIYAGLGGKHAWLCALAGALGFAFSGTFWFEAAHAKGGIYTLAVLACAAALFFALKFLNSGLKKYMYLALYTAAFLPGIHLTASLVMLFVIILVFSQTAGKKAFVPAAALVFLTAMATPLLYLIIRAFSQAEIRWADTNSLAGIIVVITRKTYYSPADMPFSMHVFFFKFYNHLLQYVRDYAFLIPPALFGLYAVFRKNTGLLLLSAGFIFINAAAVLVLTGNSFSPVYLYVNKGFYLIADMGTAIFAAVGICALAEMIKKKASPLLTSGFFLIIPVIALALNYNQANLSSSFVAYDHAKNIEKTLKQGDTFLCGSDTPVFNIAYMKYVKGGFAGVKIYDTNANLFDLLPYRPFRGKMTNEKLRELNAELASLNPLRTFSSEYLVYPEKNLKPQPFGIIYRLIPIDAIAEKTGNIAAAYTLRAYSFAKHADIAEREILARYFVSKAQERGYEGDRQGFENNRVLAEKICPDNPGIISSIASAYFHGTGDIFMSIKYLEKAVIMDPYYMGAIRLLTRLYAQTDAQAARKWAVIYMEREWDKAKAAEVKAEFGL